MIIRYSKNSISASTPEQTSILPIKPIALSLAQANYASEFYNKLKVYIIEFEENLSEHEEVAIKLVSFGESIVVHVHDIGYENPSLITFSGEVGSGERVQLIQHVTQISFLLMAVNASKPVPPRERIGYKLQHERDSNRSS